MGGYFILINIVLNNIFLFIQYTDKVLQKIEDLIFKIKNKKKFFFDFLFEYLKVI